MLQAAEAHYTEQTRRAALVGRRMLQFWQGVPPGDVNAWRRALPRAAALVAAAQFQAASAAEPYVAGALEEQGVNVPPVVQVSARGFMGFASDGRPLATLLDVPRIRALVDIKEGLSAEEAVARAGRRAQMLAVSQVQDAGRQAESVAIFARPKVGWVRMVNPPCCDRCAVLAGKWFRSSEGFDRHPRCSCLHIPALEEAADVGPSTAELVGAGVRAEQQGMAPADAARGARRTPPEAIFRRTRSRGEALALLQRQGFIAA